jgi:sigma-B regulation protein RsbU (phosphoserine phosphatase)
MSNSTTSIIRNTFQGLDAPTLEALRAVAKRHHYPANVTLCHQGEMEHTFYVVVEGHVTVVQRLENGEERVLNIIGPNGYFGEMGLIDDSPRVADCVTMTDAVVLEVTEESFDKFLEHSPVLAYQILHKVLARARRNDQRNIQALEEKNRALEEAYKELTAAQAELVEKERIEREMELAATVQRSLLPESLPQFPDYRFSAYLTPARQVGGDFYDVIALDDEHVGMVIADVADKGFHAALFMAVTRTLFLQESQRSHSPAEVALAVHQGMLDVASADDIFLTAFYGVLHRPSGRLTYVRAAQERPLLLRPDQPPVSLVGDGRFLGMLEGLQLLEYEVTIRPGDRLVMFSDGVPDAVNEKYEHFGNDRLTRVVQHGRDLSAERLTQYIFDQVDLFTGNAPPFDDLTLLVMEAVG